MKILRSADVIILFLDQLFLEHPAFMKKLINPLCQIRMTILCQLTIQLDIELTETYVTSSSSYHQVIKLSGAYIDCYTKVVVKLTRYRIIDEAMILAMSSCISSAHLC